MGPASPEWSARMLRVGFLASWCWAKRTSVAEWTLAFAATERIEEFRCCRCVAASKEQAQTIS